MARFKMVNGERISLSAEEEAARDAEEAAWRITTDDEIDQDTLNRALVEPGSMVRALGLTMFAEINKLRIKTGNAAYTMPQFIAALKARIR